MRAQTERIALRLERTIQASRERVFAAWTTPELLRQWSAPEGMDIPDSGMDLRVGGKWYVIMTGPGGQRHHAFGTYREIRPPERLVYTHAWKTDERITPETLLTVEFYEEADATRIVMTQVGFESQSMRDGHREGWTSCFDQLERLFVKG